MSGSPPEIYRPLPPQHIRILRLGELHQPSTLFQINEKEHLYGHLETVSLQEITENSDDYVALSYCWRRPIPDPDKRAHSNILLGHHLFHLQPNLFAALRNLARNPGGPRSIWADAICINQSNVEEKNQQVALMGDIYRGVGKVVVWLGPEGHLGRDVLTALEYGARKKREHPPDTTSGSDVHHPDSESAFLFESEPSSSGSRSDYSSGSEDEARPAARADKVPRVSLAARIKRKLGRGKAQKGGTQTDEAQIHEPPLMRKKYQTTFEQLEDALGLKADNLKTGLAFISECGWFNRTWTFQEISLAKSAVVRIGDSEISWDDFVFGWTSKFVRDNQDWRDIRREIRFIQRARLRESDLLLLLRCVWNREATDLRDKAYGVLGLLKNNSTIVPDYNLSVREAYVRISRAAIEETGTLDLLHFSGLANAQEPLWGPFKDPSTPVPRSLFDENQDGTGGWHLPSWVPDYGSARLELPSGRRSDYLTPLEFIKLDPKFKMDLRWDGELLVTAGLALGRLALVPGHRNYTGIRITVTPFPHCAFDSKLDNWSVSQRLGKALEHRPPISAATKTDMESFVRKVHEHDVGHCCCKERGLEESGASSPSSEERGLNMRNRPWETIVQPLDWLVIPFGARSPVVLRPDCRKNLSRVSGFRAKHKHATDGHFAPSHQHGRHPHTFVLVEAYDKGEFLRDRPDWKALMNEFTGKIDRLADLSLVYGDFSLR